MATTYICEVCNKEDKNQLEFKLKIWKSDGEVTHEMGLCLSCFNKLENQISNREDAKGRDLVKIDTILKKMDVRDRNSDLAHETRRRAVERRANTYGKIVALKSAVERELLIAVYAYEEVLSEKNNRRTSDASTWRMIKRRGILKAAEKAVNRNTDPINYSLLAEMGMHKWTFESVIVRHSEKFSPEVVERAKERLEEFQNISA